MTTEIQHKYATEVLEHSPCSASGRQYKVSCIKAVLA